MQQHTLRVMDQIIHNYYNPNLYVFPQDSIGIQQANTPQQVVLLIKKKFNTRFGSHSLIKWDYSTTITSSTRNPQVEQFGVFCKRCTNNLVYHKNKTFDTKYRLFRMNKYHIHGDDKKLQSELNRQIKKGRLSHCLKYKKLGEKLEKMKDEQKEIKTAYAYIKNLPHGTFAQTKYQLAHKYFGIDYGQYKSIIRRIQKEYDRNILEIFQEFDQKGYNYSFLPSNILEKNKILLEEQNKQMALKKANIMNQGEQDEYQKLNPQHWNLPNLLIIITPQMKELYKKYGQFVGFDLTFSLIKQHPESTKQYLVGIFGGTSESQRICIYAFVITNSQTVPAYKFLFSEFFRIMGQCPQTVITDEENSIYHALKQLKQENVFTGIHLFDTFHILKKFRKVSGIQGDSFQLLRQLIHAKNKRQYSYLFNKIMMQVQNDDQLTSLRNFDYNRHMYCVSQIQPTFVGTGISDSPCEKVHGLVKQQIRYQIGYTKGVLIILDILRKRNDLNTFGYINHYKMQERLNIPLIKPYRFNLSKNVFIILTKTVILSGQHRIMKKQYNQLKQAKSIQMQAQKMRIQQIYQSYYFVDTSFGPFTVFKLHSSKSSQNKWRCECQYEQKIGLPCSHIIKVLIYLGQDFYNNINQRWLIKQSDIEQKSKDFGGNISIVGKVKRRNRNRQGFQNGIPDQVKQPQQKQPQQTNYISQQREYSDAVTINTQATQITKGNDDLQSEKSQIASSDSDDLEENPIAPEIVKEKKINRSNNKKKKWMSKINQKNAINPLINRFWSERQREIYLKFIINNFERMKNIQKPIVDFDGFSKMSEALKTKNPQQCRIYHYKKLSAFKNLENIIFKFNPKMGHSYQKIKRYMN